MAGQRRVANKRVARKRIVEVGSLVANLPEALLHDISVDARRWVTVAGPPGSSRYVQVLTVDGALRVEVSSNRFLEASDLLSEAEESVLTDLGLAPPDDEGWACNWWWIGEGPEGCLAASSLIAEVVFEVFGVPLGFPLVLDRFSTLPPGSRAGTFRSS